VGARQKFHGLHDKTDDDDMGHVAVRAGGSTWPLTPTRMSRAVPGAHTIHTLQHAQIAVLDA